MSSPETSSRWLPEYGKLGSGVRRHGRASGWVRSAPGSKLKAVMRLDACGSNYGCGGDMAGGGVLSGSKRVATTRHKRARGRRGSKEKLTGSAAVVSGSSGKQRSGRTVVGDLGGPRLKKMVVRAFGCVRGRLAW